MYEYFTDLAKVIMQDAISIAKGLRQPLIDPLHILLGAIKQPRIVEILTSMHVNIVNVEERALEQLKMYPPADGDTLLTKIPCTPDSKKIIQLAREESKGLEKNYVGTEHILLSLLRIDNCFANSILVNEGASLSTARELTRELYQNPTELTPELQAGLNRLVSAFFGIETFTYVQALEAAYKIIIAHQGADNAIEMAMRNIRAGATPI